MDVGKEICFEDINKAYTKLYNDSIPEELALKMQEICNMNLTELKEFYSKQMQSEQQIGVRVVSYIDDGANINARNVEDGIARIKEKMKQ